VDSATDKLSKEQGTPVGKDHQSSSRNNSAQVNKEEED